MNEESQPLGLYESFDLTELCHERLPKDYKLTPELLSLQNCLLPEKGISPILHKMALTTVSSAEMTYYDNKTRRRETLFRTNRFDRLSIKTINAWIINAIYRRFEKDPATLFHRFYRSEPVKLRPSAFELKVNYVEPYLVDVNPVDEYGNREGGTRHYPDLEMVECYTFDEKGWHKEEMTLEDAELKAKKSNRQ